MQTRVDQEHRLLDFTERLARHAEDRSALHMHFSRLKPHNRQERQLRMIASGFDRIIKRHDGYLFQLSNLDQVLIVKGTTYADLETDIAELRALFADDPAARANGDEDMFMWYDLAVEYHEFKGVVAQMKELADVSRRIEAKRRSESPSTVQLKPVVPIDPGHLGRLVEQLASMDISSLLRRQPVCALTASGEARPVFNELFVSIADLQRTVMPDVQLGASTPLFNYLTQYLDRRILKAMPDIEPAVPLSTSININIETVMSPVFLEFDQKLRAQTKKTIVLEFQPSDLFSDITGFTFARNFVRQRGYRICLDGVTNHTLPLIEKKMLQLDLQKLVWGAGSWDDSPSGIKQMAATVRRVGPSRIVLCRCDDQRAIDFGRSLGISLFQGRHLDNLLASRASEARVA